MASIISAGTTSGTALNMTADTSGQLQFATGASATTALTIDTSQNATFAGTVAMSSSFLRNRIINGDMRIDQRNAGASVNNVSAAVTYTLDRWSYFGGSGASKFSVQQQTSIVPTGFTYATKITSLSAYTVGSTEENTFFQQIEGYNVADLSWGTVNAKTITFSFWVYSSLTGTFGGAIRNGAADRSYPFSYTINSANTWEQKSITVTGDTTGTWATNNTSGMIAGFSIGNGSGTVAAAGSWTAGNKSGATGCVSLLGTNGATLYITGVQLEVGSTATPFERRLYNQELANCQRYYYKWINDTAGAVDIAVFQNYASGSSFGKLFDYPVTMRATPTATSSGTFKPYNPSGTPQAAFTTFNPDDITKQNVGGGAWTGSSGLTAGNATGIQAAANSFIAVTAEL